MTVKSKKHGLYLLSSDDLKALNFLKKQEQRDDEKPKSKVAGMIGTYQESIPLVWGVDGFRHDQNKNTPVHTLSPYAEKCYNDVMRLWNGRE
jgi:hypothetical protein